MITCLQINCNLFVDFNVLIVRQISPVDIPDFEKLGEQSIPLFNFPKLPIDKSPRVRYTAFCCQELYWLALDSDSLTAFYHTLAMTRSSNN